MAVQNHALTAWIERPFVQLDFSNNSVIYALHQIYTSRHLHIAYNLALAPNRA